MPKQEINEIVHVKMRDEKTGQYLPTKPRTEKQIQHKSVQKLAKAYTLEALGTLVELMRGASSEKTKLSATETILAYAWGKPATVQIEADRDGNPLAEISTRELRLILTETTKTPIESSTDAEEDEPIDVTPSE